MLGDPTNEMPDGAGREGVFSNAGEGEAPNRRSYVEARKVVSNGRSSLEGDFPAHGVDVCGRGEEDTCSRPAREGQYVDFEIGIRIFAGDVAGDHS